MNYMIAPGIYYGNSPEDIITFLSIQNKVPIEDIVSKKRDRPIIDTRQMCIYFIKRKFKQKTLISIANMFNMTHSSVIHSIKQVENIMSYDEIYNNKIKNLSIILEAKL